jgi:hypothetical protein
MTTSRTRILRRQNANSPDKNDVPGHKIGLGHFIKEKYGCCEQIYVFVGKYCDFVGKKLVFVGRKPGFVGRISEFVGKTADLSFL